MTQLSDEYFLRDRQLSGFVKIAGFASWQKPEVELDDLLSTGRRLSAAAFLDAEKCN
jgi:hypothetical protein